MVTDEKLDKLPIKWTFNYMGIDNSRYLSKRSQKAFQNTSIFWIIEDSELEKKLAYLSSKSVLIDFTDQYLISITNFIKEKYFINLELEDEIRDNSVKIKENREKILKIKDEPIYKWFKEVGLPKLDNILNKIYLKNKEDIIKLGAIEDFMSVSLKLGKKNFPNNEVYLYDVLYQLEERLEDENFLKKQTEHFYNIKRFSDGSLEESFSYIIQE